MIMFCQNIAYNNYKVSNVKIHAQFIQNMLSERTDNMGRIGNFLIVYWGEIKSNEIM